MSLNGRTAVVTGSTSGIGYAIANGLAQAGANVVINGLGEEKAIEKAVQTVGAHGTRVLFDGANMLRHNQIADMIAKAEKELGAVDILVNNAGIQHVAPLEEFPIEQWDAILAINLTSAFHTTRAALPSMRCNKFGRIINIASAHGLVASPFKAAYVAAKHGIVGLTKAVALETATTGVTCNAICPGWVLTPLVQKQIDDRSAREGIPVTQAQNDLLREKQPSLQFTTVEQLGGLAVFLCSPAADQVRGVAWQVDGGWTAQ
jgi:3-hydroxybutyrate dehydrogenase